MKTRRRPDAKTRPRRATRPLVVAHRGGAPYDIENSLAAFVHGVQVGSDVIECDLRTVRDGTVVLFHNEHSEREPVRMLPVETLRQRVSTLLTFAEFVEWATVHERPPRIVLDLKERELDRRIAPVLANDDFRRRVIVTTQHTGSIRRLTSAFPDLRIGLSRGQAAAGANPPAVRPWIVRLLRPVLFYWLLPQLRWSRATAVVIHHRLATPRNVRQFRRAGLWVYVWTVDDCLEAQPLVADGRRSDRDKCSLAVARLSGTIRRRSVRRFSVAPAIIVLPDVAGFNLPALGIARCVRQAAPLETLDQDILINSGYLHRGPVRLGQG